MWIFNQQMGRVELVLNPDHITRLLGEGGIEVSDPRVKPVEEVQPIEESHERPEEQHEQVSKITDIRHTRRRRKASQ